MKVFFMACVLGSLLFLASGCTKQDTTPTADKDASGQTEEHKVMKPVVPDEETTSEQTGEDE